VKNEKLDIIAMVFSSSKGTKYYIEKIMKKIINKRDQFKDLNWGDNID